MRFIVSTTIFILVITTAFQEEVNAASLKADPLLEEFGRHPSKATFYDEEFFNGSSTNGDLPEGSTCRNLPTRWRGKPLSVDTSGTCVNLCSGLDCSGECRRVYPNNGDLRLSTVGLLRKVTSLKSCF